jgi:hypothetical protein
LSTTRNDTRFVPTWKSDVPATAPTLSPDARQRDSIVSEAVVAVVAALVD